MLSSEQAQKKVAICNNRLQLQERSLIFQDDYHKFLSRHCCFTKGFSLP